jgi:2-polyprenyl-6-methoxyphenol hydroxylase-like FAD-dependent oxidoreductase
VEVVVVGAGFAGLSVARALIAQDHDVIVLERRASLESGGAAITLQPNGLAALARLGVLDDVLAICRPVSDVVQTDARGRRLALIRYGDLRHPHPYVAGVARSDLVRLLARGIDVRLGAPVAAADVARLGADLVVGADGVGSAVREAMRPRVADRSGPDRYVVGICRVVPPGDPGARLVCGRGYANGVIPMREGLYFWDHVTEANAAAVEARDFGAWAEEYARRVPGGEAIAAEIGSFEGLAVLEGRTHRVKSRVSGRFALAGDAAAAVHPHTGQGGNLALEDAVALADGLRGGGSLDDALAAYAQARDAKARRYVPWSRFIGPALDGSNLLWRALRASGYVWARVPPLRRELVRMHAGLR